MPTNANFPDLADAFAFLGNSLLAPISQTSDLGLDPSFWSIFPTFNDDAVAEAVSACTAYAQVASKRQEQGENVRQAISVEYAKLFVGPPKPAVAPWETAWRSTGSVGFGEATIQMRHLLAESRLDASGASNQYADHIGIELLYASVLCGRIANGETTEEELRAFLRKHPLIWVDAFSAAVAEAAPKGYYVHLIELAARIMLAIG
ncbi:MAG: molecular chaperone TorD family protein [Eggerthellaceae bacterium]|nr:molecular chaperone TorD family protein [Eggerthellaceae bacterium]